MQTFVRHYFHATQFFTRTNHRLMWSPNCIWSQKHSSFFQETMSRRQMIPWANVQLLSMLFCHPVSCALISIAADFSRFLANWKSSLRLWRFQQASWVASFKTCQAVKGLCHQMPFGPRSRGLGELLKTQR